MTSRRAFSVVAIAVASVAVSVGTARAQNPPLEQPAEGTHPEASDSHAQAEARHRFQAGAADYEAQRYAQAIEEFRAAYRLFPTPVILFNLAQAYRGDGRLSEAVAAFRQFVDESPNLADTQRQDVETAVAEIEAQRAVLSFEVEPAGGTLRLDGREIGTLPLPRAIEVLPGAHAIEIRLDRYVTHTDTVTLRPHQRRLYTATLAPVAVSGRVVVHVLPTDSEITLDGVLVGLGQITRDVPPGDHTVTLHHAGYGDFYRSFHLGPLGTETIALTLHARSMFQSPWFWAAVAGGAALIVGGAWLAVHTGERTPIPGNAPPSVVQSFTAY